MSKGFLHIKRFGLIYARIPKVANSSIKTILAEVVDVNNQEELKPTNDRFWKVCVSGAHFMDACRYTQIYDKKLSFTFIRDPLDRLFSCYVNKIIVDKNSIGFANRGYRANMSFDEFVAHTCSMPISDMDVHTKPQDFLITDVEGRPPKFIGLLENLDRDWSRLLKLFSENGIPITKKLPTLNSRKKDREGVSKDLSEETLRRFNWVYGPDVELYLRTQRQNEANSR